MALIIPEDQAHLSDIIKKIRYSGDRVVLTRKGKRLVAIVPLEDLEVLEAIEDKIDLEEAEKALLEIEKDGTITWSDLKQELGL